MEKTAHERGRRPNNHFSTFKNKLIGKKYRIRLVGRSANSSRLLVTRQNYSQEGGKRHLQKSDNKETRKKKRERKRKKIKVDKKKEKNREKKK